MSDDAVRLVVASGPFARASVSRLISIAAARADLPLDRVEDALMLGAAVVARAPEHVAGDDHRLELEVRTRSGALELVVAPLRPGAVRELLGDTAGGGAGPNVFRRVADGARLDRATSGAERLVLEIAAPAA